MAGHHTTRIKAGHRPHHNGRTLQKMSNEHQRGELRFAERLVFSTGTISKKSNKTKGQNSKKRKKIETDESSGWPPRRNMQDYFSTCDRQVWARDVKARDRDETETRPRRWLHQPRRDRDRDATLKFRDETETFVALET